MVRVRVPAFVAAGVLLVAAAVGAEAPTSKLYGVEWRSLDAALKAAQETPGKAVFLLQTLGDPKGFM